MRAISCLTALALAAAPVPRTAAEGPAPSAAVDPTVAAASPARPDLHARPLDVVGLGGLAELGPDPEVQGRTERLRGRRTLAILSFVGAATAATVGGFLYVGETAVSNLTFCSGGIACQTNPADHSASLASFAVAAGLAIAGLVALPREREYAATVDLWNARHPEQPAEWVGWSRRPERDNVSTEAAAPAGAALTSPR
jgi:hypothetical protein